MDKTISVSWAGFDVSLAWSVKKKQGIVNEVYTLPSKGFNQVLWRHAEAIRDTSNSLRALFAMF